MPTTKNPLTAGWKGTFGKKVVFRQRGEQTIISNYPDMSNRVLTAKQLKINKLMKEANRYARSILNDEQSRIEAQARLNVQRNKLYNSLIREYYKNNYSPETAPTDPATIKDQENIPPSVQFDFMKYLLENTTKSIAEISSMTKIDISQVSIYKNIYRKQKEEKELFQKFKESKKGKA